MTFAQLMNNLKGLTIEQLKELMRKSGARI